MVALVAKHAVSTVLAVALLVGGLVIGLVAGFGVLASNQSAPKAAFTTTETETSVGSSPPSTTTLTESAVNPTITTVTNATVTVTAPVVTSTSTETSVAVETTTSFTTQTSFSTRTSTVTSTMTTSPPYPAIVAVVKVPSNIPVTNGTLTVNCNLGAAAAANAHITVTDTVSYSISISSMSLTYDGGTYTAQLQGCEMGPLGSSTDVASILISGLPVQPNTGDPFAGALGLGTGAQLQLVGNFAAPYAP